MSKSEDKIDLLSPGASFRENYSYQLQQTIDAYSISKIVIGEAIQNAIDAVCETDKREGYININIDFDTSQIIVEDNGKGFPKQFSLLYLGGGTKSDKKLKGKVGVGIKVTLFCSNFFSIRSQLGNNSWKIDIENACNFKELLQLEIPTDFPNDPHPLENSGTQITYRFPKEKDFLKEFIHEVIDTTLPKGLDKEFGKTIKNFNTGFPSPIATLLAVFLQRYSYIGDTLASINKQDRFPSNGIKIRFNFKANDLKKYFDPEIANLFGTESEQTFEIYPKYFTIEDSLSWIPKGKMKPSIFQDKLGRGGSNLERTDGFNILTFDSDEGYESLITNKKGELPSSVATYRRYLFEKINAIHLIIGKIPDFELYTPGGSQRLISCNGIVTDHSIELTRGRNQAYVRCFEIFVDVDAQLNYGKTHLTNTKLVKWIREYINDAYVRVIQPAANEWVGRVSDSIEEEDQDTFLDKKDLNLPQYITKKVPRDENDVIGLFFEMAGKGLFSDYRIFGLSQKNKYDCRATIKREKDDDSILNPNDSRDLRVIEFKVEASEVIRDFERKNKFPREIDLVIAWNEGKYESKYYKIYDIDQSKAYNASPKRLFPNANKFIYDTKDRTEIQVILLSEFLNSYLNEQIY